MKHFVTLSGVTISAKHCNNFTNNCHIQPRLLPEVKLAPGDPGVGDVTSYAASLTLAACTVIQPPHIIVVAAPWRARTK